MDDTQKTLSELSTLLHRFPGVSVGSTDLRQDNISVEFKVKVIESIGPIVYESNGANILMDIWSSAPETLSTSAATLHIYTTELRQDTPKIIPMMHWRKYKISAIFLYGTSTVSVQFQVRRQTVYLQCGMENL
jgi:hypothetical protein